MVNGVNTCTDCDSADSLARCTVCDNLVCPAHRVGTGSLSDGYQCASASRTCWATEMMEHFVVGPAAPDRRRVREVAAFIAMVICLVLFGVVVSILTDMPR